MKLTFTLLLGVLLITLKPIFAQENPVKFKVEMHEDTLVFHAEIDKGWHMYAANLPDPTGGPLPTEIIYNDPSPRTIGAIIEPEGHTEMDEAFGIEVKYFETETFYKQVIADAPKIISGTVYFMVCNDQMCIPLEYHFNQAFK
ncbi:MAG: hypothetical protein H6599_03920 [Flavobacteriales bacterium]|nr:hypothetical protein [Flavobacteriales bacterium]